MASSPDGAAAEQSSWLSVDNWQAWAVAAAVVAAPFAVAAAKDAAVQASIQHTATAAKPSTLALAVLKYGSAKFEPLFAYEGKLARLPVPSLEETQGRYLAGIKALCATPEEFAQAKEQAVQFFQSDIAKQLQKTLLSRAASSRNWLAEWWLQFAYLYGRDPLVINVSFGTTSNYWRGLLTPVGDQALRAAGLIVGALHFRRRILTQDVPVLKAGGVVPVDMSGYKYIFGTTRVPGETVDSLVTHDAPGLTGTAHILVVRGSAYWTVAVQEGSWTATVPELHSALQHIIDTTDAQEGGAFADPPIALLTTDSRDRWAAARSTLRKSTLNAASLASIEQAQMCVILHEGGDDTPLADGADLGQGVHGMSPPLLNSAMKQFWADGGDGRRHWYDKSLGVYVLPSGEAGLVVEHSYADAPVPSHAWEHVVLHEERLAGAGYAEVLGGSADPPRRPPCHHLQWDVPGWDAAAAASLAPPSWTLVQSSSLGWAPKEGVEGGLPAWCSGEWDAVVAPAPPAGAEGAAGASEEHAPSDGQAALLPMLHGARRRFDALVRRVHMRTKVVTWLGKSSLKAFRMSPDAFAQQVLQLASLAFHGEVVLTYESASTRAFECGRTETIRSATAEARTAAEAILAAVLRGEDHISTGLPGEGSKATPVTAPQLHAAVATLQRHNQWTGTAPAAGEAAPTLREQLQRAVKRHSALTRAAMRGEGVDRHVLGLKLAALTTGTALPAFFTSPETHVSLGGGFGAITDPGVGVAYFIQPEAMYFHIATRSGLKEGAQHITGKTSKRQGLYKKHLLDGTRWWGGTFVQDLWVNFKNNHPLFSMCLGHRKHPLGSAERFIILTFELLLKMFVAGIISLLQDVDVDTTSFSAQFVSGIIVTLICTIFLKLLGFCATCDDRFFGDTQGGLLKAIGSCFGGCMLCMSWTIMLCAWRKARCSVPVGHCSPPSLRTGFGATGLVLVATSESSSLATYFSVTGLSLAQSWFLVWPVLNGTIVFGLLRWNQKRKQSAKTGHPVDNVSVAELEWWSTHDFPPDADQEAVVGADGESRGGELEEQAAGAHTNPLYGTPGGVAAVPVPGAATAPAALPGAPSPGPGEGHGAATSMHVAPMPGSPSDQV
ncbi:Cpt1b [Symbiodinium sp. KB8]|nr:Cpt1b [Symbiodinium sp. KB8]